MCGCAHQGMAESGQRRAVWTREIGGSNPPPLTQGRCHGGRSSTVRALGCGPSDVGSTPIDHPNWASNTAGLVNAWRRGRLRDLISPVIRDRYPATRPFPRSVHVPRETDLTWAREALAPGSTPGRGIQSSSVFMVRAGVPTDASHASAPPFPGRPRCPLSSVEEQRASNPCAGVRIVQGVQCHRRPPTRPEMA